MQKICKTCDKNFEIDKEDLNFYEKMKVPPPTFCFPCRLQRKLVFRNERGLYNAICDLCKKSTLSIIPNNKSNLVYCVSCWVSESWQAEDFGIDYNFTKTFFQQFNELLHSVPVRALTTSSGTNINSKYNNTSSYLKNCYLIYGSNACEDCMYGTEITNNSTNNIDCMINSSVSNAYESINCDHCSDIRFCIDCKDSFDILYSKNLSNCSNCIGCINLRNKKHCIFNEQFSKEEYFEKIKTFNLNTDSGHSNIFKKSTDFFKKFPVKYFHGFSNLNFSGDYIYKSKNIQNSFIVTESEDCKYCYNIVVKGVKDCMDYSDWGANAERVYESQSCGAGVSNLKFCLFVSKNSSDCEYSAYCGNCQNIFGCVGLRNKEYCIFNKQFTKNEYFEIKAKIIKQMDTMTYFDQKNIIYKYGEFFPPELSLFPYDDTTAQEVFVLNENQAKLAGFSWSKKNRNYNFDFNFSDIPDDIHNTDSQYIEKIIACKNKEDKISHPYYIEGYKILEKEFKFYKKNEIPIPRCCFNCRYHRRLKERNPLKLWHRQCMKEGCTNTFETSYSPERPEIVYCERCYQQEVY